MNPNPNSLINDLMAAIEAAAKAKRNNESSPALQKTPEKPVAQASEQPSPSELKSFLEKTFPGVKFVTTDKRSEEPQEIPRTPRTLVGHPLPILPKKERDQFIELVAVLSMIVFENDNNMSNFSKSFVTSSIQIYNIRQEEILDAVKRLSIVSLADPNIVLPALSFGLRLNNR